MNHYTYRAVWSPEDGEFVGLVAEFPSLSWLAATPQDAIAGVSVLVDQVLEDMQANGEPIPQSMTERSYSGRFVCRVSPSLHRDLAIEAAEEGVSLNHLVNKKLCSA